MHLEPGDTVDRRTARERSTARLRPPHVPRAVQAALERLVRVRARARVRVRVRDRFRVRVRVLGLGERLAQRRVDGGGVGCSHREHLAHKTERMLGNVVGNVVTQV